MSSKNNKSKKGNQKQKSNVKAEETLLEEKEKKSESKTVSNKNENKSLEENKKVVKNNTEKTEKKTKKSNIDEQDSKEDKSKEKKDIKEETIKEKEETTTKIKIEKEKDLEKDTNEVEQNEETVEENIEKKKHKWYSIFFIFILLIIISLFSTIFALINMNNINIAKGVKIKNIDVSGLNKEQAFSKIEKALEIELEQNLKLEYEDKFDINIECEQIDFKYDIDKAINEAYEIGRSGNIIQNNYAILYATFIGKNINIEYTYNEEYLMSFINDTETKIPGVVTSPSYYIEEATLIVNKGKDGIGIDKDKFKNDILENIYKRNAENIINNQNENKIDIPIVSKKAEPIDIEQIYKEIYTEPKDAYYELEPFNIYPEVNGVDLENGLEDAKKQISEEDKEEYRFQLKITAPEKTIKSFGIEAFPNLISSFSTKYNVREVNRTKNLEIAAGKINGLVLMPGEVFSYNTVVGKRTVEEGYKDAKIYQDGAVVDGLAGGICQISSTLYNAVLLANLEIVERRNHSFTTSYVPAGRDATVVYGKTDFQFKNSRSYPIKIEASVARGIATFKIHGVSLEETEYEVKIIPVITESIPYTTEHVQDITLAPGQQVITQAGHAGYKVTTYKELIQNGVSVSKEVLSNDVYRPMRAIVRIGP